MDAAKLLQACEVPWPPLVEQVLHDVAQELDRADGAVAGTEG